MAIQKVTTQSPAKPPAVASHRTATGNSFTAKVTESYDAKTRLNIAAPKPGANYKAFTIHVKYEDKKGLFDGANEINVNANGKEVRRNFGKGNKDDRNLQASTGAALHRTGPHTFEGDVTFILEGVPGKSREDVSNMGFTFAQLKDNSFAQAKFDGAKFQEYRIPMKLIGP